VETSPTVIDETVLLVHGTGVSARSWGEQVRSLGRALRVVAVDLPGHGESDPTSEVTLEGYADAAQGVLEALGTRPVVAVGHSLGGAVALMLAARQRKIVNGLVLVSSCARLPSSGGILETLFWLLPDVIRKVVFVAMRAVFVAMAKKILFAPGAPPEAVRVGIEEIRTCRPETILKDTAVGRAMDLEELARGLSVPTLILCGGQDRLTPPALSERLRDLIPHSRLHLVAAAGHMLPLEAPQQVTDAILEFVGTCTGTDASRPLPAGGARWRSIVRRLLDKARAFVRGRMGPVRHAASPPLG
jgi:pimeloyl-ACP methyl ester carboxylesterase